MVAKKATELLPDPVIKEILRSPGYLEIFGTTYFNLHEIDIYSHLQKAGSHPNIIQMYGASEDYIALEYAKGKPVSKILNKLCVKKSDLYLFFRFCEDVTRGLSFLAEQDVRHGDLKADNIILCDDGTFKIIDLGEATICRPGTNDVHQGFVSAQDPGNKYPNPKTDCWCLGLILMNAIGGDISPLIKKGEHYKKNIIDDFVKKTVIDAKFKYSDLVVSYLTFLIQSLLNPDIEDRLSAREAFKISTVLKNCVEQEDINKFMTYFKRS